MKKIEADVVIIGSGTAGMKAYRMARRKTNQVLMVEGAHFGTTCALSLIHISEPTRPY